MQDAFAVRRMTCCSAFTAEKIGEKMLSERQTLSLLLCLWSAYGTNPALDPAMKARYILICVICVILHNACHIYRVRAGLS